MHSIFLYDIGTVIAETYSGTPWFHFCLFAEPEMPAIFRRSLAT